MHRFKKCVRGHPSLNEPQSLPDFLITILFFILSVTSVLNEPNTASIDLIVKVMVTKNIHFLIIDRERSLI